jgi:hypothetical protein
MNTHARLIALLRKLQAAQQNPLCRELLTESDETLMRVYFRNYRAGDKDNARGLRLTESGLLTFKCFFKSYDIKLPGDYKVKSLHLVYLDRTCTMPWHITGPHLTLFETSLALRAKLVGDLELLREVFV